MKSILGAFALVLSFASIVSGQSTTVTHTFVWTATGDDASSGRARWYDIRYRLESLSLATWSDATPVANPPFPSLAGLTDSVTIANLVRGARYAFAVQAYDEWGNSSGLSNVVTFNAGSVVTDVVSSEMPLRPTVYPNPFFNRVEIVAGLPFPAHVRLDIYDLTGRLMVRVNDSLHPSGIFGASWTPPASVPAGIYWYKLQIGQDYVTGKIVRVH